MPLIAIITPLIIGWLISGLLLSDKYLWEKLGLSWPLGIGIFDIGLICLWSDRI